jgi:hypothetical protein
VRAHYMPGVMSGCHVCPRLGFIFGSVVLDDTNASDAVRMSDTSSLFDVVNV